MQDFVLLAVELGLCAWMLLWIYPRCIGLWVILKGLWNEAKDRLENR